MFFSGGSPRAGPDIKGQQLMATHFEEVLGSLDYIGLDEEIR